MEFYSPKNFKNGRFIMNRFRPLDLVLLIGGWAFSILSSLIYLTGEHSFHIGILFILLVPLLVTTFLVQPFGTYHNFLEYLKLWYQYSIIQRNYKWEGFYKYEEKI